MNRGTILTAVCILCAGLLLNQCEKNIFSFSAPDQTEASLIEEGRTLMNDGDYEGAREKFAAAMENDSTSTAARYYHSKATLHASGFNAIILSRKLAGLQSGSTSSQNLPFMDMSKDSSNILYQANNTILRNLKPIADGTYSGRFTRQDINLDLTMATATSGILSFKDTNNDGAINSQDINLDVFLNPGGQVTIEDLDSLQNNPDALNSMIDNVGTLMNDAGSLITDILGDTTSGVDTEAIDQLINDVSATANFYYINSGVPGNPGEGDNDGDGAVDEECLNGIDDDGDGLIDEDARSFNCP
ncbi:MAG: hypothetical protein K9N46_11820 [Candidatus Marinimicrobia bacterium]|nr:hypothetical protein [Candidatus Neomarinimicrobiota bacterium]MCF7827351.1 hypothetical protein [Candidatus Neomarinimicrobiota bacterium]MCF7881416.1 hypothetical protein [Candidatus Neomarinimicrobiota bacterium]